MKRLMISLILLSACKHAEEKLLPIRDGKCRVIEYNTSEPNRRECVYEGYLWTCWKDSCRMERQATPEDTSR